MVAKLEYADVSRAMSKVSKICSQYHKTCRIANEDAAVLEIMADANRRKQELVK